jgi:hypothetical protein
MATDKFSDSVDSLSAPAREAFPVVPHDNNELSQLPKALLISGAGTIKLQAADSQADVTITVAAGQQIDIRARFVRATGTTATGIIGLA